MRALLYKYQNQEEQQWMNKPKDLLFAKILIRLIAIICN